MPINDGPPIKSGDVKSRFNVSESHYDYNDPFNKGVLNRFDIERDRPQTTAIKAFVKQTILSDVG